MPALEISADAQVNDIVVLPDGRKIIYVGGNVWKSLNPDYTHNNEGPLNNNEPPIEQDTPPELPNKNPFWYQKSTGKLHYQALTGEGTDRTRAWVEV